MGTKTGLLKQYFNHSESIRRLIQKRYFLIVSLAFLPCMAYIWVRDPIEQGFTPPCLFFLFTGLHCPGCGTLRALHQLLNGNIRDAFWLNPLIFLSIPFATFLFLIMRSKSLHTKFLRSRFYLNLEILFCFSIVCAYWVLRNTNIKPFAFANS